MYKAIKSLAYFRIVRIVCFLSVLHLQIFTERFFFVQLHFREQRAVLALGSLKAGSVTVAYRAHPPKA